MKIKNPGGSWEPTTKSKIKKYHEISTTDPTIASLLGFIVHPGLKRFSPPAHSHQVGGELSRGSCGLLSMGLFFGAPRMLLIEHLHHSVLISRNCCFHAMLRMSICVILSWNIY